MFFVKEEERIVTLHPSFFGPHAQKYLWNELVKDVEGKLISDYYVIAVLENHSSSEGKIIPGAGRADYTLHYRAICWRPFKGEVVGLCVSHVI